MIFLQLFASMILILATSVKLNQVTMHLTDKVSFIAIQTLLLYFVWY